MAVYFDAVGQIVPVKESEKFKAVELRKFGAYARKTVRFNLRTNKGANVLMEIGAFYNADDDGKPTNEVKVWNNKVGEWITYDQRKYPEYEELGRFQTVFYEGNVFATRNVLKAYEEDRISERDADKYNLHDDEEYKVLKKSFSQRVRRFLFDIDFVNYVELLLNNYDTYLKGRLFKVSGEWTARYAETTGKYYTTFAPNYIGYEMNEDAAQEVILKAPFVYGKDALEEKDGETHAHLYAPIFLREYKNEITKGKYLMPLDAVLPADRRAEAIKPRFTNVDFTTSEYKEWNAKVEYFSGAEKKDIDEPDLTPDEKFDIECGFRTLEEIKAEHAREDQKGGNKYNSNQVYGERIIKYTLIGCDKGVVGDTEYAAESFELPVHEAVEQTKKVVNEAISNDDDDIFDI